MKYSCLYVYTLNTETNCWLHEADVVMFCIQEKGKHIVYKINTATISVFKNNPDFYLVLNQFRGQMSGANSAQESINIF